MDLLRIRGGIPLAGTVAASGAKNAALPIMAASILASEPVTLEHVPHLADVDTLSLLLGYLGVEVKRRPDDRLQIATVAPQRIFADYELVQQMRASFCVLGPLLARRGRAVVPLPGGCQIGERPIDLHLHGLAALRCRSANPARPRRGPRRSVARHSNSSGRPARADGYRNGQCALRRGLGPRADDHHRRRNRARDRRPGQLLKSDLARASTAWALRRSRSWASSDSPAVRTPLFPIGSKPPRCCVAAAITGGSVKVTGVAPEHLAAVLAELDRAGLAVAD